MNTGSHHIRAIGLLNVGMIWILWIRAMEVIRAAEGKGTAGHQGIVTERSQVLTQLLSWLH